MDKDLKNKIKSWIKDYEATRPENLDYDDETFEGSAYGILKAVLAEFGGNKYNRLLNGIKKTDKFRLLTDKQLRDWEFAIDEALKSMDDDQCHCVAIGELERVSSELCAVRI